MLMYPGEYRLMYEMEDGYWWYVGIRTLLGSLIERQFNSRRDLKILDVGCGTGANLLLLRDYGDAFGIDLSEEAVALCRARGVAPERALVASAAALAFRDGFFDLAISFDVICNIRDDVAAIAEIARTLKPGGGLILLMPAYQWLWSMHDIATAHQRRYDARTLSDKLTRAGLRVERVGHINALLFPIVAALRLLRRARGEANKPVHSDLAPLPHALNTILAALFGLEARVAAWIDLPFGVSVFAVARKT
jgi:SAM-dependent methyltransferase